MASTVHQDSGPGLGIPDLLAPTLLLANVALKTLFRQQSFKILFVLSSLFVCGGLWLMWLLSYGEFESFLHTGSYAQMTFDVMCSASSPNMINSSDLFCMPYKDSTSKHNKLTPSDLLFDVIGSQSGTHSTQESQQLQQLTSLISSMMMNGLPLLGLADYIYLSDFANKYVNNGTKNKLMSYPGYRDKFGNFLSARNRELRITPRSCWAAEFAWHLRNTSDSAKVGFLLACLLASALVS